MITRYRVPDASFFPRPHTLLRWQIISCILSIFFGFSISPAADSNINANSSLDKLINDIQLKVNTTSTIQCTFEQERNLSVFAQPIIFSGKMELVRPGKLRWENIEPIPSVLIFAGEKGLRCNDDAEPVHFELEKDPIMKMVAEQIWTWVDGDYARLQNKYDISLSQERMITLVPRSGEFADIITSVTINFDDQSLQPQTIHIKEVEGDTTTIRFSGYRLNEPVEDNLFTTCYP